MLKRSLVLSFFATFATLVALGQPRIAQGGYLLDSGSPYRLWFCFTLGFRVKNPMQGNRLDCYGLLHEAKKELAPAFGSPPVESERELIQVVIEMLVADRSLVGSRQPPFEEADHAVNSWHQLRGSLFVTS